MGALKTGGQGSVYKAKRIGEIVSAIKILPTPIYSESGDDKNFVAFQNEVQKLKKVNEDANPNVVTILNSGITDSGNFPFIEMEYIEGPGLEEQLKPPHDLVFTIQESLKVAEQLSNALAHCHKADVKHGDIKSNNVKFNSHTGNYILLDFGLSVMSDEQRRTSLRQAGAIEFMAPEQHEGLLLFQSEVYSFGIIMFELLSGTVPFPLKDNSESARNTVVVSQLESAPPNLLSLRQQHLPEWWSKEKKEHEMSVPEWLVSMIYKCLEKNPGDRFSDGMELHTHIVRNRILAAGNVEWGAGRIAKMEGENELLREEVDLLRKKLLIYEESGKLMEYAGDNKRTPGKALFNVKNILIIVLLLGCVGLVVYPRFINKAQIVQGARPPATLLNITNPVDAGNFQLNKGREVLMSGRLEEARLIYKALAVQEIPEAMYEYGNLTLLNGNDKSDCAQALEYLKKAALSGYVPAKRTIGFLYSFADDSNALKEKGYSGCDFPYDVPRGSKLLMEAMLKGDSIAGRLLDDLNTRYGIQ